MPTKPLFTLVAGKRLKLTNLDKVLYPNVPVMKAEVVQYYLKMAEHMLPFVEDRALSLIRWPDGITGQRFYTKNAPSWTPDWINRIAYKHSEKTINYLTVSDAAGLVWLANLASLEIHSVQNQIKDGLFADHFIFDLDPPEDGDFEVVKEVALKLKDFLENYNYQVFIKTSGSKGVHLYVPISPKYSADDVMESVKKMAVSFTKKNPKTCTMNIQKLARKGRILIDVLRNHESHTCIVPYSMRGTEVASVSLPMSWKFFKDIESSQVATVNNIDEWLEKDPEPWKGFFESAVDLHDRQSKESKEAMEKALGKLADYHKKRDFNSTDEPPAAVAAGPGNRFVIQLHDARNLHYDLRLEDEGVLRSWAIPKGLPEKLKQQRLAIETEPHPLQYLTWEGIIPKGEYGAGQMWVFIGGTFKWINKKDDNISVHLKGKNFDRIYHLGKTKDNTWLCRLSSKSAIIDEMPKKIEPMLAGMMEKIPPDDNHHFEIKWDGIRAILFFDGKSIRIQSRSGRDITDRFPEIAEAASQLKVESAVMDGEIVRLDESGSPQFGEVISRMHKTGKEAIRKMSKSHPAFCYLYDLIYLDGRDIRKEPIERRRAWLKTIMKSGGSLRYSDTFEDGGALWSAAEKMSLEGVMAKKKGGVYTEGVRNDNWIKIKFRHTESCLIIGYAVTDGERGSTFRSLHLALPDGKGLKYMGKVGTGFDMAKLKELRSIFDECGIDKKPVKDHVPEQTVWLERHLWCEIQFASLSSTGHYREPVFLALRPDL